jgi:lipopolysaccharide transport system permease protein
MLQSPHPSTQTPLKGTPVTKTVIEGDGRWDFSPFALWREYSEYSTLLRYLAMRDVHLRFRNPSLGALWVTLQPLLPMVVFSFVFARFLQPSTGGVPYSLFVLAGLVPWTFFSSAVSTAGMTFAWNANLLTKVYFPRAILPAAAVMASSLELGVGCLLLCLYSVSKGYWPRWSWLCIPLLAAAMAGLAFFTSLALATLNALHRDVKFAVPFVMQLWIYASPVVYSASMLPAKRRWLLGLNPLAGVLEGFRWALVGAAPQWGVFWTSLASSLVLALAAVCLFRYFDAVLAERV